MVENAPENSDKSKGFMQKLSVQAKPGTLVTYDTHKRKFFEYRHNNHSIREVADLGNYLEIYH